ncbi:unnamed protein product [Musa acuminata subsp. malaccensis]|uniref:(wild Malaysian banana) hypothetical protein n=1 Tax=Musa acuminata subsp. malaccensis TaxID=214687 RepID=A0A8D7F8T6_MUSAM|nr:unnamed protein product [Musa acuminata subsp. malaccensis]
MSSSPEVSPGGGEIRRRTATATSRKPVETRRGQKKPATAEKLGPRLRREKSAATRAAATARWNRCSTAACISFSWIAMGNQPPNPTKRRLPLLAEVKKDRILFCCQTFVFLSFPSLSRSLAPSGRERKASTSRSVSPKYPLHLRDLHSHQSLKKPS